MTAVVVSSTAVPVGERQLRAQRERSDRGQLPTAGEPDEGLMSRVAKVKLSLPTGGYC